MLFLHAAFYTLLLIIFGYLNAAMFMGNSLVW